MRERLFESGEPNKDSGIDPGTTIVKEVVDAHDGDTDVAERSEGGARFETTLPAHRITEA